MTSHQLRQEFPGVLSMVNVVENLRGMRTAHKIGKDNKVANGERE